MKQRRQRRVAYKEEEFKMSHFRQEGIEAEINRAMVERYAQSGMRSSVRVPQRTKTSLEVGAMTTVAKKKNVSKSTLRKIV